MLKFLPFIVKAMGIYCKILKRGVIYIDMYFSQNTLRVYSSEDIRCFFQLSKRLSYSDPEIQSRSLILFKKEKDTHIYIKQVKLVDLHVGRRIESHGGSSDLLPG